MRERLKKCARQAALLFIIVGLIVPGVGYTLSAPEVSHAAPSFNDDDDTDTADRSETERSIRDDRQIKGQVLEINSLKDPPEMSIANMDGVVKVRMLTTDLIAKNSVRLGDHVTLVGEKVSEVEFECQEMSVDGHLGDDVDDSDD